MWLFEGHGLEFMPLDVRRKLDVAGFKPSLKDWESITLDQRRALADAPESAFEAAVLAALPNVARTAPSDRPWNRAKDAVVAHAKSLGLSLDWDALDEPQRYALHRLSDPKKDANKFKAAVAEFAKR